MEKICKQCLRSLADEEFRPYPAKGKGIRQTTRGRHTVCRACENINMQAAAYMTNKKQEPARIQEFVDLYTLIKQRGGKVPPVGTRIMGDEPVAPHVRGASTAVKDMLAALSADSASNTETLCRALLVRLTDRQFDSTEAAALEVDKMKDALKECGLFEEADKLLEDWEMEED